MTRDALKKVIKNNTRHELAALDILDAVDAYSSASNSIKLPVSSSAIQAVCDKVAKFSDDTFGNARPYTAPLHHLKKEVDEAITDGELVEFADCLLLLLDAYRKKFGGNVDMLLKSASDKVDECYQRSWGKADENGVVEHIR